MAFFLKSLDFKMTISLVSRKPCQVSHFSEDFCVSNLVIIVLMDTHILAIKTCYMNISKADDLITLIHHIVESSR